MVNWRNEICGDCGFHYWHRGTLGKCRRIIGPFVEQQDQACPNFIPREPDGEEGAPAEEGTGG